MNGHPSDDMLHDLTDGELPGHAATTVERHLAGCTSCAGRVGRLLALRSAAGALPRSVDPEQDLWPGIRAAIDQRKVVALPQGAPRSRPRWATAAALAAAAVFLVVASSLVTALVIGGRGPRELAAWRDTMPAGAGRTAPGASFATLEADYLRAAAELSASLDARRGQLSPETVATVERSLRVIDDAIAEARAALARDPANEDLAHMLAKTYRQKLDLLRRTAELSVRM